MPSELLINISEIVILSVYITLASTHIFNFAGRLAVAEIPVLPGIDMEHVSVCVFVIILGLNNNKLEFGLTIVFLGLLSNC